MQNQTVTHSGQCHCGAVRWESGLRIAQRSSGAVTFTCPASLYRAIGSCRSPSLSPPPLPPPLPPLLLATAGLSLMRHPTWWPGIATVSSYVRATMLMFYSIPSLWLGRGWPPPLPPLSLLLSYRHHCDPCCSALLMGCSVMPWCLFFAGSPAAALSCGLQLQRSAQKLACPIQAAAALTSSRAGSICAMKRNTHCIVPEADFRLVQGGEELSWYQVGRAAGMGGGAARRKRACLEAAEANAAKGFAPRR